MKRLILFFLIILTISLSACSKKEDTKTEQCLIPNSYLTYTGMSAEKMVESITSIGDQYSSGATVCEDGVEITFTEKQKESFLKRDKDYAKELISDFLEANELYQWEYDQENHTINCYYDEKIPILIQLNTVFGVATGYALDDMIENQTKDWSMQINIFNCHTGKKVTTINIPKDEVSLRPEDWEKSYED